MNWFCFVLFLFHFLYQFFFFHSLTFLRDRFADSICLERNVVLSNAKPSETKAKICIIIHLIHVKRKNYFPVGLLWRYSIFDFDLIWFRLNVLLLFCFSIEINSNHMQRTEMCLFKIDLVPHVSLPTKCIAIQMNKWTPIFKWKALHFSVALEFSLCLDVYVTRVGAGRAAWLRLWFFL